MEQKKCMIVGSGLMVPCLISTLINLGYKVSVSGNVESELVQLSTTFQIPTHKVDVTNSQELTSILMGYSIVVSMVPAIFHHHVLKACIFHRINIVTPSYVSENMQAYEQEAIDAGIVVLNEIGLDPGIDHMSVIQKLKQIRALGGKVREFYSSCGAFPAPEACTNLFSYKLAWAPYGALLAAVRPSKFFMDGELVDLNGEQLMDFAKPYDLVFDIPLSYYPNGDSCKYREKYNLEEAKTIMRCSLRYENYPIICKGLSILGIYNENPQEFHNFT